ncbi:MAG: hypothetical protein JNL09_01220 [Anaerolineales bacterium]|nr:hypothetical protein [Anaerolineales bacterium]
MLISSIDHLHLTAPHGADEQTREFYGGVLGLNEIEAPAALQARGGVWFECGRTNLHVGPDERSTSYFASFQVASAAALKEALTQAEVRVEEEQSLEGVERLYCRDPFGNHLEFIENAFASGGAKMQPAATQNWLAQPNLVETYSTAAGSVERVALSADGQWLAAGTAVENERGTHKPGISLWHFGQMSEPEVEIELSASTWELAFSPSGRELVCLAQDGSLETWRADTGEFENDQFVELSEDPSGLAYSDNGGLLAVGTEDVVEVYRPGLEPLVTIRPQLGEINAVAFDPNAMLAISGEALRIQLWQIRPVQSSSWELLGHASSAIILRFCPSHPFLAAVTEHGQVLLWDVNEGPETPRTLGGEMSGAEALAFSPDGEVLACGDDAGNVWLWNWQAEAVIVQIENNSPVTTLAFSPNGSQLLVGSEDGRVRVYQVR